MPIHPKNYQRRQESASSQRRAPVSSQGLWRTAVLTVLSPAALLGMTPIAVAQDGNRQIEEITVTATKRETSLQETAAAVSVLSEATIDKRHLAGMEDYLAGVPGVSYQDRGASSNTITIRGIGLGSQLDQNSPVGSYFGEVPLTGLGSSVNGNQAGNADLKLVDISRIEVLRGPQGTLYGSGTMGGTVRIIPNLPNLQEVEGKVAAQYSHTGERGGDNTMFQGVLSAPLVEDELAVRMVAYRFENSGYIDNVAGSNPDETTAQAVALGAVARDQQGMGEDEYNGFRVTGLWQPTDDFTLNLSHIFQGITQIGLREVEMGLPGDFQQSGVRVGAKGSSDEYVNIDLNITNLIMEYDLGWGRLLNSTSHISNDVGSDFDITFLGNTLATFTGTDSLNTREHDVFINELRFASQLEGPFQLLGGLYYEDRTTHTSQIIRWTGVGPEPPGTFNFKAEGKGGLEHFAAFGELSYDISEPLTITLGGRYFEFERTVPLSTEFDVPTDQQGIQASIDDFTFKANLSYSISEQVFVYGEWSQGFRAPLLQGLITPEYDVDNDGLVEFADGIERDPPEGLLEPDTVDNYEAGVKFQSNNGRFAGSLTGFRIDWEGIPIVPSLTAHLGAALYFNAGQARSEGVEFEASAEVFDDLILELAASWVDSTLTEDAEGLGVAGDDLPGSADYNVKAAVEKRFAVGDYESFVRGDYTYVSEYFSTFSETPPPAGDYHLFDLSTGVSMDNINIGVFVKNLTNTDDFTWVDNVFGAGGRAYRLRPRTVGVEFSAAF